VRLPGATHPVHVLPSAALPSDHAISLPQSSGVRPRALHNTGSIHVGDEWNLEISYSIARACTLALCSTCRANSTDRAMALPGPSTARVATRSNTETAKDCAVVSKVVVLHVRSRLCGTNHFRVRIGCDARA
jgi:hypothetical protein